MTTGLKRSAGVANSFGIVLAAVAFLVILQASQVYSVEALSKRATYGDHKWQPATDYDTDGCYPTAAVGKDGEAAGGLKTTGALDGNCRDESDLENTNSYCRTKCVGGWCAHFYAYYFEKDQTTSLGCSICGHRHDMEHVIVWVENDVARFVSRSAHGKYYARAIDDVRMEDTHPKIVYHKEGAGTHVFRFANKDDEPPENHKGEWQYPTLRSWKLLPSKVRDKLNNHDFGSAKLDIKDDRFIDTLRRARPDEVPFDV